MLQSGEPGRVIHSTLLRRYTTILPVRRIEIVPRQRHRLLVVGELELEHALPIVAERQLSGDEETSS